MATSKNVEVVPAVLRSTFEKIEADWNIIREGTSHIQIDITDGVFAGDGSFREVQRFKRLIDSEKCELHMMVQTPGSYVDDVIDLNPARCVFHLEAFAGQGDIQFVYEKLREGTSAELALALNPTTPNERLEEHIKLIDYVLFMGYNPGWANQPIDPGVYRKIAEFKAKHKNMPVAVDGHVDKETVEPYVRAGASILCANTSIFGRGNPTENLKQLQLLAEAALDSK